MIYIENKSNTPEAVIVLGLRDDERMNGELIEIFIRSLHVIILLHNNFFIFFQENLKYQIAMYNHRDCANITNQL